MGSQTGGEVLAANPATGEPGQALGVEVVVPAAEKLELDEIRKLVGAKNVMGTCSG